MASISIDRLQLALSTLSLAEPDLVRISPAVARLLARQQQLDSGERLADWMEIPTPENAAQVVADQIAATGLVATAPRPWFAGLRQLRRRIVQLGNLQSRQLEAFLAITPRDQAAAVVQLALLFSVIEPGIAATSILAIAKGLRGAVTL
jgi:hypothetical protein